MDPATSPVTEYRPIPGFEGYYDMSQDGEVRSLKGGKPRRLGKKQTSYHLTAPGKEGHFMRHHMAEAAWPDPEEVWKPIPEFGWVYEVSNRGRVRSRACGGKTGSNIPRTFPKVMKPGRDKDGYRKLGFYSEPGLRVTRRVSRLVLEAFVGPCPAYHEASHLDGSKDNDHLDNLVWEDRGANNRRRREHGTMPSGEKHPHSRLTRAQVKYIRREARKLASRLGEELGYTQNGIMNVIENKTWKEVEE
jgi:hypothetical protein